MRLLGTLAAACMAGLCGSVSAQVSASFNVVINVSRPGAAAAQETCVSESLRASGSALVQVVCRNGNFVGIEPRPGSLLFGERVNVFRLSGGRLAGIEPDGDPSAVAAGVGTITGLKLSYFHLVEQPLEVLIVF
jgi:hypothetical protein